MSEWKKITRVQRSSHHQLDLLDGSPITDGAKFRVRFPNGAEKVLSAVSRRWVVIHGEHHGKVIEEQIFFADEHEGLPTVWVRGIDVEIKPFLA